MKAKAGDAEAKEFARDAAGRFTAGTFKASETGARRLAEKRKAFSDMGEMAKSMTAGTKEAEEYIRSGKYKKGGK
jgi:hypothetical protein